VIGKPPTGSKRLNILSGLAEKEKYAALKTAENRKD